MSQGYMALSHSRFHASDLAGGPWLLFLLVEQESAFPLDTVGAAMGEES